MISVDFSNNKLTNITAGLLQLPNLSLLNLSHNKLTHLPDIPVWSAALTHVDLSNNLFTSMPMNITASALTSLNLSKNKLSEVPLCVCTFTKLTSLEISENPSIKSLPYEMSLLTKLKELNLNGLKRLKEPPKSSVGSVKKCILYLQKKFSGYADGMDYVQLMIVGNTEIGKNRFASTMYGKEFKYNNDIRVCVRELEYRPNVTKRLLLFRTWIFKALEDYQATHHCFLSQRSLYVLLFNLNDGCEGVYDLKPWLKSISHQAPYSALIVIGMSHLDEPNNIRDTDIIMQQAEMAVAAFANNLESLGTFTIGVKNLAQNVKSVLNATHQYAVNIGCHVFLDHETKLHKLCQDGNLVRIKAFVNDIDPQVLSYKLGNRKGIFGYTPLHNAVVSGNPEVLHYLLKKTKNANINCRANSGFSPLHLAASSGHGKCVKTLLEHGANINCVDEYGKTPKQTAELKSKSIIVKLLRSEGEC